MLRSLFHLFVGCCGCIPWKTFSHLRKIYGIESLRRNEEEEDASKEKISHQSQEGLLTRMIPLSACSLVECLGCKGWRSEESCPDAPSSMRGKQINTITYWETCWAKRTPIQIQAGVSARVRKIIQATFVSLPGVGIVLGASAPVYSCIIKKWGCIWLAWINCKVTLDLSLSPRSLSLAIQLLIEFLIRRHLPAFPPVCHHLRKAHTFSPMYTKLSYGICQRRISLESWQFFCDKLSRSECLVILEYCLTANTIAYILDKKYRPKRYTVFHHYVFPLQSSENGYRVADTFMDGLPPFSSALRLTTPFCTWCAFYTNKEREWSLLEQMSWEQQGWAKKKKVLGMKNIGKHWFSTRFLAWIELLSWLRFKSRVSTSAWLLKNPARAELSELELELGLLSRAWARAEKRPKKPSTSLDTSATTNDAVVSVCQLPSVFPE